VSKNQPEYGHLSVITHYRTKKQKTLPPLFRDLKAGGLISVFVHDDDFAVNNINVD
jgi:hypothetical protein